MASPPRALCLPAASWPCPSLLAGAVHARDAAPGAAHCSTRATPRPALLTAPRVAACCSSARACPPPPLNTGGRTHPAPSPHGPVPRRASARLASARGRATASARAPLVAPAPSLAVPLRRGLVGAAPVPAPRPLDSGGYARPDAPLRPLTRIGLLAL
nr:DBF4-type zinc finger-containing protein 2 homolog [Aegilops tauschii subsp. strangulata]